MNSGDSLKKLPLSLVYPLSSRLRQVASMRSCSATRSLQPRETVPRMKLLMTTNCCLIAHDIHAPCSHLKSHRYRYSPGQIPQAFVPQIIPGNVACAVPWSTDHGPNHHLRCGSGNSLSEITATYGLATNLSARWDLVVVGNVICALPRAHGQTSIRILLHGTSHISMTQPSGN